MQKESSKQQTPSSNESELADEIYATYELKNAFPTAAKIARYVDALCDLDQLAVIKALRHLAKTKPGMPDPAEVRLQVVGSTIPYSETAAAKRERDIRAEQQRQLHAPAPDERKVLKHMNDQRRLVGLPEISSLAELRPGA